MSNLSEVVNRAIADYGFRQGVVWGADAVARQWGLSDRELAVLQDTLIPELEALPIPVEPADQPARAGQVCGVGQGCRVGAVGLQHVVGVGPGECRVVPAEAIWLATLG